MKDLIIEPLKRVGEIILQEKNYFTQTNEMQDRGYLDFEYDEDDRILSIIIRQDIQEKYNVLLYGINIFQVTLDDLIKKISKRSICKFDGSGFEYFFPKLNIVILRDLEHMTSTRNISSIATVIISTKYYDNCLSDKLIDWKEGLICESVYRNLNVNQTKPTQSDLEGIRKKYDL